MKITLSPCASLPGQLTSTVVTKAGDILTINNTELDFTPLPDGATLPAEAVNSVWIAGAVSRIDGELHLTLRLPHGPNPSHAVAFPEPIHVTQDGPIALPFDPDPEPAEVVE